MRGKPLDRNATGKRKSVWSAHPKYKKDRQRIKCHHCGKLRARSKFSNSKNTWDGVEHVCKDCRWGERKGKRRYGRRIVTEAPLGPASPPGPQHCAEKMGKRGEFCWRKLVYGVNRNGYTVMWCPIHGERLVPRISEPLPKVRLPRADMERRAEHESGRTGGLAAAKRYAGLRPKPDSGLVVDDIDY